MYIVPCPLSIPVGKKKNFIINLNHYRNAHFRTLDKAKKNFEELLGPIIKQLPQMLAVSLTYTLFARNNQLCDTANVCSVMDKFFSDTLVSMGRIPDDNYQIVKSVAFEFGKVDRDNPRVEVTIKPLGESVGSVEEVSEERELPMQITMNQREIEQAITNFVTSQVEVSSNKQINIKLRATRGSDGYQAEIAIVDRELAQGDGGTQASADAQPSAEPEVAASTQKKGSLFGQAKEVTNTPEAAVA